MEAKIVLVTGAGRGIGLETARRLFEAGHTIVAGVRSPGTAPDFAGPDRWLQVRLDVTRQQDVNEAAALVDRTFGRLDVLINNAGIMPGSAGLSSADLEEVKAIFEVNFFGPMRMNLAFLPLLRKGRKPRIIQVSSGMGALSELTGGYAGYRLSKAGLNAQTILLSAEMRQAGIAVVAVHPGWVRTAMGGPNAPRTLEQGAAGIVHLATDDAVQTGRFYYDGNIIPW